MSAIRVYVDQHCSGCDRAHSLVSRGLALCPDADLRTVDVTREPDIPATLFALPTWYIDNDIWILGNPSWEELRSQLTMTPGAADTNPPGRYRNGSVGD